MVDISSGKGPALSSCLALPLVRCWVQSRGALPLFLFLFLEAGLPKLLGSHKVVPCGLQLAVLLPQPPKSLESQARTTTPRQVPAGRGRCRGRQLVWDGSCLGPDGFPSYLSRESTGWWLWGCQVVIAEGRKGTLQAATQKTRTEQQVAGSRGGLDGGTKQLGHLPALS